jgi:SH3 domain-containing YSC84-like protein 1
MKTVLCLAVLLVSFVATDALAHRPRRVNSPSKPLPARHDLLERSERAATIIREFMDAPDHGLPQAFFNRATCIGVFPSVKKGGFGFGGQWGRGVISCRYENKGWSMPAFFNLSGGSFGLQIGLEVVDLVMIISTRSGMDALVHNKVELGAGAGATAGIIGRSTAVSTDALLGARIFSYSRSRGLFAGLELKGSVLTPDNKANQVMYKTTHVHEILSSEMSRNVEPITGAYSRSLQDTSPVKVVYVKVPRSRLQQQQPSTPSAPAPR